MMFYRRPIPLRVIITLPVILLLLITVGLTNYLSWHHIYVIKNVTEPVMVEGDANIQNTIYLIILTLLLSIILGDAIANWIARSILRQTLSIINKSYLNQQILQNLTIRELAEMAQQAQDADYQEISELKRLKSALQASQNRYRAIVQDQTELIVRYEQNGMITFVNKAFCRYFRLSRAELIGHHFQPIIFEEDREFVSQLINSMSQENPTVLIENRVIVGDEIRWTQWINLMIFDGYGQFIEYQAVGRDIHTRKQSELELQEKEAFLRIIYDGVEQSIFVVDVGSDGKFRYVGLNPAHERITGIKSADIQGKTLEQILPLEMATAVRQRYQSCVDAGKTITYEEYLPFQGQNLWWLTSLTPIRDQSSRIYRLVGSSYNINERIQTETALRQSEQRLNYLLTSSPAIIYSCHPYNYRLHFVSQNVQNLLGYTNQEVIEQENFWSNHIHPEDSDRVFSNLPKLFEKYIYAHDYRFLDANGLYRWMQSEMTLIRDEAGNPQEIVGYSIDITERKLLEIALQEKEAFIRAIGDNIPNSYLYQVIRELDGSYHFCYVSAGVEREHGLTSAAIIADPKLLYDLILEEDIAYIIQQQEESVQTMSIFDVQIRERSLEGEIRWVRLCSSPRYLEDGRIIWDGIRLDITEIKSNEEILRDSEANLAKAQKVAHIGSWEFDVVTQNVSWSEELFRIYGQDPNLPELPYFQYLQLIYPEDRQKLQEAVNEAIATGNTYEIEHRLLHADGSIRWILGRGETVCDRMGKVTKLFGTALDITESKQAKIELQQAKEAAESANHSKSLFLANMSHELRTPLNVILGFTQVLERDSTLTSEQKENLQIIHRSGSHLLNLINEILDLSKIEAGRMVLDETSFDLIALLNSLEKTLQLPVNSKNLQLHFQLSPHLPQYITTDVNKLRQVLTNLLHNAIKFTHQGTITLRAKVGDSKIDSNRDNGQINPLILDFEVEDTGIGIASEELTHIFEAFVKSQYRHSFSHQGISMIGTGLGLSISYKFVQLMNGNLKVTSQLNQGSTFCFSIPVQLSTVEAVIPTLIERRVIGLTPNHPSYRILVVDDQWENRQFLIQILMPVGLEIREAKNGEEAIQQWQQWQPHLIWMDIKMPDMNGYDTTQHIRSLPGGQMPIIIALTAQTDLTLESLSDREARSRNRTLVLNMGFNDYIIKPFQAEELFTKMGLYLELDYIYADEDQPITSSIIQEEQSITLTPENLSVMPSNWVAELYQATLCCDEEEVLHLIDEIPAEQAVLSAGLKSLVRNYQFQIILQLINLED